MDFIRRQDHTAALAEVRVTCAVLEEHAYTPIIKLLHKDAFHHFAARTNCCKSKTPRLHPDFTEKLDAAKTEGAFEVYFEPNASRSEGYQEAFLVDCNEKLCSENLLWLTHFLKMKRRVENPE